MITDIFLSVNDEAYLLLDSGTHKYHTHAYKCSFVYCVHIFLQSVQHINIKFHFWNGHDKSMSLSTNHVAKTVHNLRNICLRFNHGFNICNYLKPRYDNTLVQFPGTDDLKLLQKALGAISWSNIRSHSSWSLPWSVAFWCHTIAIFLFTEKRIPILFHPHCGTSDKMKLMFSCRTVSSPVR